MTAVSVARHPIMRVLIAIALVTALVFAVSGGGRVEAAAPDDGRALGVPVDDLNAQMCFGVGQKLKHISFAGPGGVDIPPNVSVFATPQDSLGAGVFIRKAWATAGDDTVHIRLTKPATRGGCVAWHTRITSIDPT